MAQGNAPAPQLEADRQPHRHRRRGVELNSNLHEASADSGVEMSDLPQETKRSAIPSGHSPYPPSWIDRLIQWIDRLPGSAWVFYLVSILALTVLINIVVWVDGSVPFGSYSSFQGIFPPFVFYFLALYHYLTQVGSRSLQEFRPLLDADDSDHAQIRYELASLPRGLGWLAIVIALITLPSFFLSGQAFGDRDPNTVLPYILAAFSALFFGATIFCLIIRSLRQLRMVHRLHAQATNISLLKLEPAHAFSKLTARTGIGIMLLVILGFIRDPRVFSGGLFVGGGYILMAASAIIIFVVPVMGMRDRLVKEKKQTLDETSDLLQSTGDKLERKIRADDYIDLQGMETAIRALIRKREMVEKISTWPWNPGTVRGFASTLLLPILLWLITRFLGRFV